MTLPRGLVAAVSLLLVLLGGAEARAAAPVITAQPRSTTVAEGGTTELYINDTTSCGTLSNQWQRNGVNVVDGNGIKGSNTGFITFSNAVTSFAGTYHIIVTCVSTHESTTSVDVSVFVTPVAPIITGQPQSLTTTVGGGATFIVYDQAPCGNLLPQWQFNGVNLQDGPGITGSHTGILSLNAITPAQEGSYRVVIGCTNGASVISRPATLTVTRTAAPSAQVPVIVSMKTTAISGGGATIAWIVPATSGNNVLTLTPSGGTPITVTGMPSHDVHPTVSTIYTLTATNEVGSSSQNVAVLAGSSKTVSSCQSIVAPGNYTITRNLSSTSPTVPCIDVHNTDHVFIHCSSGVVLSGSGVNISTFGGTTGGGINFTNVHDFSLDGCKVVSPPSAAATDIHYMSTFSGASMGALTKNTFGDVNVMMKQAVQIVRSAYVTFFGNKLSNAIEVWRSASVAVVTNTITNTFNLDAPQQFISSCIILGYGSGNQATNNTIDGRSLKWLNGADDGIILVDETGDIVASNTTKNTFDAGIEWSGVLRNTLITDNTVSSAGFGIMCHYNASLTGSALLRTHVASTTDLLQALNRKGDGIDLGHGCGLRPANYDGNGAPAETRAYFNNNLIAGNTIVNDSVAGPSSLFSGIEFQIPGCNAGESSLEPYQWVVGNNVVRGNDFGTGVAAPIIPPLSNIVTDGGGNICGTTTGAAYPIVCN